MKRAIQRGGVLVPAVVLCGLGAAAPTVARAAPAAEHLDSTGYVYAAPGAIYVPVAEDDFEDLVEIGFNWGIGAGGMFGPTDHFGGGIGLVFEHAPLHLDEDVDDWCGLFGECDAHAHHFRIAPELRLGAGAGRFFGYGLLSPGLGLLFARLEGTLLGQEVDEDDTDVGFAMGVGGGVQILVWSGLSLGAELAADLGFFFEDDDEDINTGGPDSDDEYQAHMLDVRFTVGWWF